MTSSNSVTAGLEWVPDACTLPTTERPLRLAEFDDLFASATTNAVASCKNPGAARVAIACIRPRP